jgi:hypothetical protein
VEVRDEEVLSQRHINAHANEIQDSAQSCIRAEGRAVVSPIKEQPEDIKMIEVITIYPEYLEKSRKNTHDEYDELVEASLLCLGLIAAP